MFVGKLRLGKWKLLEWGISLIIDVFLGYNFAIFIILGTVTGHDLSVILVFGNIFMIMGTGLLTKGSGAIICTQYWQIWSVRKPYW